MSEILRDTGRKQRCRGGKCHALGKSERSVPGGKIGKAGEQGLGRGKVKLRCAVQKK